LKPFQPDGTSTRLPQARDFAGPQFVAPGWPSLGRRANFVVQIGSVMILARLLTPSDFGIVTMVTTFSLLLRGFGLNGFTN
jgi:hypothetical protein